ncbi:hypothetical protein AURDEDRAFT_131962 [Auricularia subglabra TFB-10046 SS5]|uniref:Uncharacterized protein n=1 Tax=Auricularia subglabra (strain TFB-10046 / SS5) TaxID=717982 RepID=J0D2L4_AURST|nr:hypothetical protein AURDEDRAFT_131962 [Auricularia subglabra TFB-10046 SS5]
MTSEAIKYVGWSEVNRHEHRGGLMEEFKNAAAVRNPLAADREVTHSDHVRGDSGADVRKAVFEPEWDDEGQRQRETARALQQSRKGANDNAVGAQDEHIPGTRRFHSKIPVLAHKHKAHQLWGRDVDKYERQKLNREAVDGSHLRGGPDEEGDKAQGSWHQHTGDEHGKLLSTLRSRRRRSLRNGCPPALTATSAEPLASGGRTTALGRTQQH